MSTSNIIPFPDELEREAKRLADRFEAGIERYPLGCEKPADDRRAIEWRMAQAFHRVFALKARRDPK